MSTGTESSSYGSPVSAEEPSYMNAFCNAATDVILPNSIDLDWAQIAYAMNFKRLMCIANYKTWLSFHSMNSENCNKYMDYTPQQLCNRFLKRVLPNIYQYELTQDEECLLRLLELHPNFKKTDQGFSVCEQTEYLKYSPNKTVVGALMSDNCLKDQNFIAHTVDSNNQIVISGEEQQYLHHHFNFDEENAAFLSVILSLDEDLPNCELLRTDEIRKRLKAAKNRFELNGQQLENINISIDELLKKIKALEELRTAVTELVEKCFHK